MRIVVFGGSGFIGRHLVARLARDGHAVRIASRHGGGPSGAGIEHVRADILDARSVGSAVAGAEAVVNLVGALTESGRQGYVALHEEGARRVAAAARETGAERLVHFSALGASAAAPSLADRSKANGEAAVRGAHPGATIVRPSLVFGEDDHFFNGIARMARRLPLIPLIGGGATLFQPVAVEDVAAGCAALIEKPPGEGEVYEFGGPEVWNLEALIRFACRQVGARPWLMSLPFGAAEALGFVLQVLPKPPLTREQARLLRTDKVVSRGALQLPDLGVTPRDLRAPVSGYLAKLRG